MKWKEAPQYFAKKSRPYSEGMGGFFMTVKTFLLHVN
jgi:hypothetical protein